MTATQDLARFAAELKFEAIPANVVAKIEDLLVDWFGSALAGHGSRPVASITQFALSQGPADGPSEVMTTRGSTSPYVAAMCNGDAPWQVKP